MQSNVSDEYDPTDYFFGFVIDCLEHWLETDDNFRRETACCFAQAPLEHYAENIPMLLFALFYQKLGWSVIPTIPQDKRACIRWKHLQTRQPTYSELVGWYTDYRRLDAGIGLVLGPTASGVFAVDVDGPEASRVLRRKIELDPSVLRVRSGSQAPEKFHLYYRHPALPTNAKFTPWHPKLEFRGQGGIVVLPPTLHASGNRYTWESPLDLLLSPLQEPPQAILTALAEKSRWQGTTVAKRGQGDGRSTGLPTTNSEQSRYMTTRLPLLSQKTKQFLLGVFAFRDNWNTKLFSAACDLHGNDIPLEIAQPALLQGAKPRTDSDREIALRTITSAYSESRTPAKSFRQ